MTPSDQRLGSYRLLAQLGSGGMGVVYLAQRAFPRSGPPVALKCLRPDRLDDECREMFLDEARLHMRVDHPSFCRVSDVGTADGIPYFAMELLMGRSLADIGRRLRRVPLEECLPYLAYVLAEVCDGLHSLHGLEGPDGSCMNAVHRDVSPSNLFVLYDGSAKILDLGIAYWRDRIHHTEVGLVKGKVGYLPPEAMEGARPDRRGDVWSLGVVLWETITGLRLFRGGDRVQILRRARDLPIPAPSTQRRGVPPELDAIVTRALTRDPELRLEDASQLSRALRELAGNTTRADVEAWMDRTFPGERARAIEAVASLSGARPRDGSSEPPHLPLTSEGLPRLRWSALVERDATTETGLRLPQRRKSRRGVGLLTGAMALITAALVLAFVTPSELAESGSSAAALMPASLSARPLGPREARPPLPSFSVGTPRGEAPSEPSAAPSPEQDVEAVEAAAPSPAPPTTRPRTIVAPRRAPPPRERDARAEPARSTPPSGVVLVRSDGANGDLYFQGRPVGRTPASVRLPVGLQRLEIRRPDEPPEPLSVRVEPGRVVIVALEPSR